MKVKKMKNTKIEWTEKIWNPSIGCSKISEGCYNCYAERFALRLKAMGHPDYKNGFNFKILPHRLNEPLKIKKPSMFFVNSMSDLFHEEMPFDYLDKIFEVINETPQHTYQILTKRAERLYEYLNEYLQNKSLPKNVWIGVTVEKSKYKYRIDLLRKVNSTIRFISFEPLLDDIGELDLSDIHWVIVGGESGKRARPMKKEWVDQIFNQCKKNTIPFFFKQWGAWSIDGVKRSKKKNGRLFNGIELNEYPIVFQNQVSLLS
jgi:protein gp37